MAGFECKDSSDIPQGCISLKAGRVGRTGRLSAAATTFAYGGAFHQAFGRHAHPGRWVPRHPIRLGRRHRRHHGDIEQVRGGRVVVRRVDRFPDHGVIRANASSVIEKPYRTAPATKANPETSTSAVRWSIRPPIMPEAIP